MTISPVSQAQNPLNTMINPQQQTTAVGDQNNSTSKAADQVSISAAARALVRSEANESIVTETTESTATQITEGETGNKLNITA